MKIVFFGEDAFSNVVLTSLINWGHEVLLVVSPFYNNLIHKRLENNCLKNRIEYIRVQDLTESFFIQKLKKISPELIVITHFQKLIKKEIIDIPILGCINLHPSLLPYYRGMSPQHWPIINGEHETGITVHFVDEKADTGDIILQRKVKIHKEMYVSDLQLAFIDLYKTIVLDAITLIMNKGFIPQKQSHLLGTYYGKLKRSQCEIDINKSCDEIINLIRGVSRPYYGASLEDIVIWKAQVVQGRQYENIIPQSQKGLIYLEGIGYLLKLKDGIIKINNYEKLK